MIMITPVFCQEEIGTPRYDGFQNVTKGALWNKRPEAKIIYEGGNPSGYTVFVLKKDYYVRFVDNEHNNLDRNYIIFPAGEKIYRCDSTKKYYAAKCGNQIEYIKPVVVTNIGNNNSSDNNLNQSQSGNGNKNSNGNNNGGNNGNTNTSPNSETENTNNSATVLVVRKIYYDGSPIPYYNSYGYRYGYRHAYYRSNNRPHFMRPDPIRYSSPVRNFGRRR